MAYDFGMRIGLLQVFEQEPESGLLFGSTGVGIAAFIVHAANVANANGVRIVVTDVSTGELLGTAWVNGAVLINHPVVAAAGPALGLVEVVEVIDSDLLADLGCRAMDDYPFHVLHRTHLFLHRAQMFRTNRGRKTAHRGYRQW